MKASRVAGGNKPKKQPKAQPKNNSGKVEAQREAKFTGRTHICFVLDKSGSMDVRREAAISGFNEYVEEQKKIKDDTTLSLVLFDTSVVTPIVDQKLEDVQPIGKRDYAPSGCTALYDAVGKAIAITEGKVKSGDRALVVILTDGQENASRQITSADQMKSIVKMKEGEGNWTFTFMGCEDGWLEQASGMGVAAGNTAYMDPMNMKANVQAFSAGTMQYRSSNAAMTCSFYGAQSGQRPAIPAVGSVPVVVTPNTGWSFQLSRSTGGQNPFSSSRQIASLEQRESDLQDLIKRSTSIR